MNDKVNERLASLEAEYEAGKNMLAELDARRAALMNTMLRIEGAIQVLKELGAAEAAGPNGSAG